MSTKTENLKETRRLLKVVGDLRKKCPWDKKQTHRTLLPYLVEEAYETIDAIERGDSDAMREELGDLLLQVALHSEIASEKHRFDFEDVSKGISEKMIRRHPHIYDNTKFSDLKTHLKNWTNLKAKEKPKKFLLEGIPRALPGLQLSQRYGEIASSVGFDWENAAEVLDKVKEELGELTAEIRAKKPRRSRIEMELGDLLFTLANLARHLRVDADRSARRSAAKFADRFTRLEKNKRRQGKRLQDCPQKELDRAWEALKKR